MEEMQNINETKTLVKWFSELSINSKEIVGEKASYLSEAYNKKNFSKNVNIPAGFVVTKSAIKAFFREGNIKNAIKNIFDEIDKNNLEELKSALNKIKNLIMKTQFSKDLEEEIFEAYETLGENNIEINKSPLYNILSNASEPSFVAVRSSYRNELGDSYFNIKGNSNIIYSIKRVIASLFNTEIILEEINSNIKPEDIITAIIIQKMVQSDKSGIVYSGDTITTNAVWGLGGALKLDEVGKDEYTAERSFRVIGKKIREKKYAITRDSSGSLKLIGLKEGYSFMQVLEEHEVQELCNILLRLDDIFSERIQFEFGMVEGEISIVKIKKSNKKEKIITVEKEILKETVKEVIFDKIEDIPLIKENVFSKVQEDIIEKQEKKLKDTNFVTQTKIDILISENILGENSNPTKVRGGFLTLENIIKSNGIHPSKYIENFNTKGYGEVILNGLLINSKGLGEIWVRLSDFNNEEFKDLGGAKEKVEVNPIMGLNGIRYLLTNPELLKRELKAISKLKTKDNEVGVVIPKISSVYELKKVKEIIESLDVNLKVGIVLEIPASIQLIKDFIEDGIDAIVFSGDTLTEYLLAIDKNNIETYKFYDDTNPALMYQLEYVIRVCNRKGIKTSFIGSATDKKEMIDYLVRKNINTIIVTTEKVKVATFLIHNAEEEFIHGTDKEIRQYEMNVEKNRQKKEILEFEAVKEEEIKEKIIEDSLLNKKNECPVSITIPEETLTTKENLSEEKKLKDLGDIKNSIKLIEEEKREFLENPNIDKKIPEKNDIIESPTEKIEKSESLVIHPEGMTVEKPINVEDAIKKIDEHNNKKDEEISEKENMDLTDGNEKLEEIPEDLGEINNELKEKKVLNDIELIESEKREYLENEKNKDKNFENSLNTEITEEKSESNEDKKDVLGIF